jgi:hypothetical protein
MTLEGLKQKLSENNIPTNLYSIDDGLKPNAYILYKNYSQWEFFFLDEKGDRNNFKIFYNEEEAFDYFWNKIEIEIKYPPSTPPKSVYGN